MTESQHSESYASVSYLQKFQLNREPFAIDPDLNQDDFFLLDAERAQRLNMLYHMCQNSELLLVVSGVKGSGKTSLLNKFIDMRTDNWRQCVVNATATTNPDQLLIEIAEGFGLPQDSVNFGSGLEMLQKRLTEMKRSELMSILIIDDAHELPTASLTILLKLSELSDSDERLLRIVLFGEPSINGMFNAPELKEVKHRITHTLTMPALNEEQTLEYIQYRLSVAGLQGKSPFSASQMKQIHRQAHGVPGLINQFAQDILLGATTTRKTAPTLVTKLRSGFTVIIILGFAAMITWYLSRDVFDTLSESPSERVSKLETRELPLLPPSKKLPDTKDYDAISGHSTSAEISPDIKPDNTPKETDNIHVDAPPPEITIAKSDTTPQANEKNTQSTVVEPIITKSLPKSKPAIKPTPVATVKAKITKTTPSISAPKPVAVKKDWLTQQNPAYFTLQIMGSRQRNSLTLVQRTHKLAKQSAIVRTKLKGADWYILIYRSFATKRQAREAVKSLPKALQLAQPWPRQLAEIKNLK